MNVPISIVLIEHNEDIRNGICSYLKTQTDFVVVGVSFSINETLTMVAELIPDIVLLEIITFGTDGINAIRHLRQISPRTQVVILTSSEKEELLISAIEAGAVSYNLKTMKMEWLAEELRRVYQGVFRLYPNVATAILQNIYMDNDSRCSIFMNLTNHELNVIRLAANSESNIKICESLLISETMVDAYINNIMNKLHTTGHLRKMHIDICSC